MREGARIYGRIFMYARRARELLRRYRGSSHGAGAEEDAMVRTGIEQRRAIRTARERRRWTQLELARRVGCSESQIAKIETGRAWPRDWLKEALARELGIRTWEVVL